MHVLRHRSDLGQWELVLRDPDPRLGAHVLAYEGYTERAASFTRRRHLPSGEAVLIVNFGPALRRIDPTDPTRPIDGRHAWIGGLRDRPLLTETTGAVHCLEARFTPIGAHRFLGLPMHALTNGVVELEDILGAAARRLTARLQEAAGWEARFATLDAFIAERFDNARAVSPAVAWAWHALHKTGGCVAIGTLAGELGWSRKRLIAAFREAVGLSPKLLARIVRFQCAIRRLDRREEPRWTDIAHDCGYYDQAHFIKDFRAFAGSTPSEYLRRRLPDLDSARSD
jgi:AraC-like DNA-binding protein